MVPQGTKERRLQSKFFLAQKISRPEK
jgi:hypothetical protein